VHDSPPFVLTMSVRRALAGTHLASDEACWERRLGPFH